MDQSKEMARIAWNALNDKKGEDIVCFYVGEKSTIADYMIIATGNVDTHVKALAEYVSVELKKEDIHPVYHEGTEHGVWVCIDYGDIIVHVMRKNEREFSNLESIWGGCPKI